VELARTVNIGVPLLDRVTEDGLLAASPGTVVGQSPSRGIVVAAAGEVVSVSEEPLSALPAPGDGSLRVVFLKLGIAEVPTHGCIRASVI
jgi:hypothetical protein